MNPAALAIRTTMFTESRWAVKVSLATMRATTSPVDQDRRREASELAAAGVTLRPSWLAPSVFA